MSEQVDKLMQEITTTMNLSQSELTELLARLASHMKSTGVINACLAEMNSREWMILYKAVLEVEAGL